MLDFELNLTILRTRGASRASGESSPGVIHSISSAANARRACLSTPPNLQIDPSQSAHCLVLFCLLF